MRHVVLSSVVLGAAVLGAACAEEQLVPIGPQLSIETTMIDFGAVPCPREKTGSITVENTGDQDLVLDIASDSEDVRVPAQLVIPPQERRGIETTVVPRRKGGLGANVSIDGNYLDNVVVFAEGTGIGMYFDPPVLDFGELLGDRTKDLTLTVYADDIADLTLGVPTNPHFEIIGATSTRFVPPDGFTATFTVRFLSSATPIAHEATIPITTSGGVCAPVGLTLRGATVP
jgi:hypothetical protein